MVVASGIMPLNLSLMLVPQNPYHNLLSRFGTRLSHAISSQISPTKSCRSDPLEQAEPRQRLMPYLTDIS